MRLISLTVLCSALLAASGVQAENLVRNPSFQGLAEWQLPDDSSQIAAEAGVLRLGAPRLLMQQSIPLVPQDSYRLSYEFQAPASARCRIYLEWTRNTAEGVQWLGSGAGFTAGDGGWITVSREFDYTADSVPPYLVVQSAGDGPVAVRNLSVERLERIQPTPGNLVRNPSFVRFLEWQLPADRSEITAEAGVLRLGAPRVLQQQSIPLAPQDSYRLSYEFQASASAQCRIYLEWTQNTAEGVLWHGSGAGFIAGDGGWTAVSREFDYTADSTPPYLVIQSAGDGPVAIRNLRVERLERIQMASEIGGEWNCPTGSRVVSLEGHPAIETGSGTLRIVGVPVTAGREYALSCSMLGRGNSGEVSGYHPYRISVTFPEAGITEDGPWDDTQADSVQRKSFTFIAPPGATRAEIAWRIMTQGRMTVGALELSERVIPLEERFKIELASPIYRNSIYASMPVDAIAGRVAGDLPIASCRVELRRGGNLLSRSDGAEFSFPAAALAEGDYRLDAEAVLENGETVQIGAGVRKLPPSPFEVVIGDDLNLYVNGELFYPVGFFQIVGNTDATFADAASNGVNMILLEGVNTAEQLLPILELSARHGVKVMLYTWNMRGVDAASEARWRQHLAGLLTPEALAHPALLGYFLDDEPSWGGRPLNWLTGSYALLKELDPYRPIWINAAPRGTVGEHRDYSAACDIYGVDIYPVPSPDPHGALDDKRLTVVGAYAERMALATGYRKPVWMVLQGFAWGSYTGASQGIYPDATQNRFMLYDALIHHGTGVSYWGTQYIGDPDFYSVLFRGTREMHAMSGLLGSGRPVEGVVSDNPAIQLHTLELDGHRYLIALNASEAAQEAGITGLAGRLEVFFEGRAVEAPSGSFRDHFEPYGVHVYGTAPLPPPAYRLPDAGNDAGALPKWVRQNRLYDGGAAWIWDAETRNTPSSRAWMMREFSLDGEVKSAILRISADDTADVWLNGVKLGKSGSFTRMASFRELPLQAGVNCLAVDAADGGVLPCGILADLELVLADGTVRHIVSDTEWRSAPSAPQDWTQLQPEWFSRPTAVVAPYGGGAWGNQTRIDD